MKVIFLDLDGVLAVNYQQEDDYGSGFHPAFVANLKSIIDATGAKIVVSSSWRKGGHSFPDLNGLQFIQSLWKARNLPGEVINVTCTLALKRDGCIGFHNDKKHQHPTPKINGYSIPRGCEIEYWLKEEGKFQRSNWSKAEQQKLMDKGVVENYVIIDDDSDFLYNQREHYVRCSNQGDADAVDGNGLTKFGALKAIDILNSSLVQLYY